MKSKLFFGLLFIIIGVIYGLQELKVISDIGLSVNIIFPIIMIIIGLLLLINNHNIIFGGIVTLIGAVNLIDDWFPQVNKIIFPGILVIVGIEILFGSLFKKPHPKFNIVLDTDDVVNAVACLGGVEKKIVSQDFKGGKATALLGGVVLDLTEIKLTSDVVLEITAFMGGVEIKLPANLKIKSDVNGFLGGVEIKHNQTGIPAEHVLLLKGTAFMGGVEVK